MDISKSVIVGLPETVLPSIVANELCCALGDHQDGEHWVDRRQSWQHTRVADPDTPQADHAQILFVHYDALVLAVAALVQV